MYSFGKLVQWLGVILIAAPFIVFGGEWILYLLAGSPGGERGMSVGFWAVLIGFYSLPIGVLAFLLGWALSVGE